jgi:hypothetical protein
MRQFKSAANSVEAETIHRFHHSPGQGGVVTVDGDGEIFDVPETFFAKNGDPAVGDYFIRRGDGYLLWRSKADFERRYSPA